MADDHAHSHDATGDYVHGEMDIHQHQASYELFNNAFKWGSYVIAVVLTFVVLLTCTKAGWMAALIVAVVVAVLGFLFLKPKAGASH